jgi:ABC-2 type transport system permease protein
MTGGAGRWLLLRSLVVKDLKVRYKRSVLGFFWFLLKPLFSMAVYTVVFTRIIRFGGAIEHFSLFLLTGLLPWNFFSASLNSSTRALLDNTRLIRSVYFPRTTLPVAGVVANAVHLGLALCVLEAALIAFGHPPGLSIVLVVPATLLMIAMVSGMGMILAVGNVFYRDVSQLVEILLLAWFYASPIIYPLGEGLVPAAVESVVRFNPLAGLLEIYHSCLYSGGWPPVWTWLSLLGWTGFFLAVGTAVFRRAEPVVVKEL